MSPKYRETRLVKGIRKRCCPPVPAAMTSMVAATGSAAQGPGKGSSGVIMKAPYKMPARPTYASAGLMTSGMRSRTGAKTASTPPQPSSHAREKVEK